MLVGIRFRDFRDSDWLFDSRKEREPIAIGSVEAEFEETGPRAALLPEGLDPHKANIGDLKRIATHATLLVGGGIQ